VTVTTTTVTTETKTVVVKQGSKATSNDTATPSQVATPADTDAVAPIIATETLNVPHDGRARMATADEDADADADEPDGSAASATSETPEKRKFAVPQADENTVYIGLRVYTHKDVPAVVVGRVKTEEKA
jgi:hypothetical protein